MVSGVSSYSQVSHTAKMHKCSTLMAVCSSAALWKTDCTLMFCPCRLTIDRALVCTRPHKKCDNEHMGRFGNNVDQVRRLDDLSPCLVVRVLIWKYFHDETGFPFILSWG